MEPRLWRVERSLGEGGSGQVFLAMDPQGARVAVKVLTDRKQSELLEHEAKLLVRLRHSGIAAVFGAKKDSSEIFGDDRGPCFWMEYVAGDDLPEAASKLPPAEKIPRVFEWFAQALEALAYLHAQDVLHGDLSPGNLRIDAHGRLKVIDFGMAAVGREARAGRAATLFYLAPERIAGRNGPACDLFSLGTIFYEILAGAHPRAGCRSLREMTAREVRPLAEAVPALAASHPVFGRVIDRMIRVSPQERFSSAAQALEALKGGVAEAAASGAAPYQSLEMAGAEEFFQKAMRAVESIAARSSLLAVHGVTGVGKTRFLREALFHCALSGWPVREIAPDDFRLGLEEAMDARTPRPGVWVFRSLERVRRDVLARLARLKKSDLPASGALLLFEWNDDFLPEDSRRLLEAMPLSSSLEEIHLLNLDQTRTKDFLRGALGEEEAGETAAFAWEKTAGNPLLLLELIELLRSRSPGSAKHVRLDSMQEILFQRLATLGAVQKGLLSLLAAARFPVGLEQTLLAAGRFFNMPQDEAVFHVLPAADHLESLGLVKADDYRLALPALEGAILKNLAPAERDSLHRAWLDVLKDEKDPHPQKIHHALELRETAIVLRGARAAAEALWREGKADEAADFVRRALDLTAADPAEASRLLRLQVNLLNALGRYPEALQSLEKAFALGADDEPLSVKTVKFWLIGGLIHQHLGQPEVAARRFHKALEEADRYGDPETVVHRVKTLAALGLQELEGGDVNRAKEHFQKGLELHPAMDRQRAELCRLMALAEAREGRWPEAQRLLEEAKELFRSQGFHADEFAAWLEQGNFDLRRGDADAAESSYAAAEAVARSHDDEILLALVWHNRGVLARRKGELAAALGLFDRALDVLRPLGKPADLADALLERAVTEAEVGRFARAGEDIRELKALAERHPAAGRKAEEAERHLKEYRDGAESSGAMDEDPEKIRAALAKLYASLPLSLQVTFVDRSDYKRWVLGKKPI